MLQMEDISDQIVMEQRMEAMKDQIVKARSQKEDNGPDKEARLGHRGGERRDPKRPRAKRVAKSSGMASAKGVCHVVYSG